MATNHLKRAHYDNNLLVAKDGKPLATVGDDRIEWYVSRNLATLIPWPDAHYKQVAQLNFVHAGKDDARPGDLIRMANQCVVCGSTETLSLHHVTPYSVKRHYPLADKANTRNLCLLLCEEHHLKIEEVNRREFDDPYEWMHNHINSIQRVTGRYIQWLKRLSIRVWMWRRGGPKGINKAYIALFEREMKPKHLPEGWLQS